MRQEKGFALRWPKHVQGPPLRDDLKKGLTSLSEGLDGGHEGGPG